MIVISWYDNGIKEYEIDINLIELHQSELKIVDGELTKTHSMIKETNLEDILEEIKK